MSESFLEAVEEREDDRRDARSKKWDINMDLEIFVGRSFSCDAVRRRAGDVEVERRRRIFRDIIIANNNNIFYPNTELIPYPTFDPDPPAAYSAPPDAMCIKEADVGATTLRFTVGTRVECRCACVNAGAAATPRAATPAATPRVLKLGSWEPGTVVKLFYRQSSFPAGTFVPYQIQLDNGKLIYTPIDRDDVVRQYVPPIPLLELLPDDLLIIILRRLALDDKVRVGMCCSGLAADTLHPSLWDKIRVNRHITNKQLSALLTRVGAREHCTSLCFVRPNNRDPPPLPGVGLDGWRGKPAGGKVVNRIGPGLMPLQGSVVLRELDLREDTNRAYHLDSIRNVVKALKKLDHLYVTPSFSEGEAKAIDKLLKIVDRNVSVRRKVCRTCKQSRPRASDDAFARSRCPAHVVEAVRSCSVCRKWTCEGALECGRGGGGGGGEPCKSPLLRRCSLCSWCVCSTCETTGRGDRTMTGGLVSCTSCSVDFCLHRACQQHVSQCCGCADAFCEDCLRFDMEGDGWCDDCQEDYDGEIDWQDEDEDDFDSDEQWSDEEGVPEAVMEAVLQAAAMMELDGGTIPLQLPAGAVMPLDDGPELPPLPPMDDGDEPLIPELNGLD